MSAYTRADLLRILRITPRQLSSWERAGLVASAEQYSFADLLQIKKINELCEMEPLPVKTICGPPSLIIVGPV